MIADRYGLLYYAHGSNDRFHVQQVYNEAVDEILASTIRRQLIAEETRINSVPPKTYSNGETMLR